MAGVKFYQVAGCDVIASKLSKEKTIEWYTQYFKDNIPHDDITVLPSGTVISDEYGKKYTLIKIYNDDGRPREPYVIASTEH